MDARQRKTRAKLSEVILRLAAERPASDLTVSEITVAAGINRSTFYQHAASPVELLEDILREELDVIRDRFLPATPSVTTDGEGVSVSAVSPSDIRDVTAAVIEHVGFHSTLYSRALGATSGASSLHPMLSRHFAESVTQLLSLHGVRIPQDDSPSSASDAYVAESAARFIADGTVGAIEVWLRTPEPRSVDSFLAVYRLLMPAWWPL